MFKQIIEKFPTERLIAVDIETTGESGDNNRIIQLGIVEFLSGKINEYSRMFGGGKSTYYALKTHKISDDRRLGEESFEERHEKILSFFSGAIIVGHNIRKSDLPIINKRINFCGKSLGTVRFIDTCTMASLAKVDVDDMKLSTLCEYFNIEYGNHDALGDARSSLFLLEKLLKYNVGKNILETRIFK
ncbi:MAG: 3'-5' exonuclease [Melioribacteraceae bacterium]|nr:3'-5' exonuclease [Melioribacteraceae bacterium]